MSLPSDAPFPHRRRAGRVGFCMLDREDRHIGQPSSVARFIQKTRDASSWGRTHPRRDQETPISGRYFLVSTGGSGEPPTPARALVSPFPVASNLICLVSDVVSTRTLIVSLPLNVPRRISSLSGSSIMFSIARRKGRAP